MQHRKILSLLLFPLILFACKSTAPMSSKTNSEIPVLKLYGDLQTHIGKRVTLEGKMTMEKFVNKAGKVGDFYEFWLEMKDSLSAIHKIKLRNVGEAISKEPFTRMVHITGKLFYGSIDADDPKVQSRVGYRLDFDTIHILPY